MIHYKKGYLVQIDSSENDGDHYKQIDCHFTNLVHAKILNDFLKLSSKESDYLNHYNASEEDIEEKFIKIIEVLKNKYSTKDIEQVIAEDALGLNFEKIQELYSDFLGYSEEGYPIREFMSLQVYKIEEDIILEDLDLESIC